MAKHVSAAPKRFAMLAILALATSFFTASISPAVAATVEGITSHAVTDRSFARKLVTHPEKNYNATFVVDSTTLSDQSFAALARKLELRAPGVFSGRLNLAQMQQIATLRGLRVTEDAEIQLAPMQATVTKRNGMDQVAPSAIQKNAFGATFNPTAGQYIWSGSNNVMNQDPLFDSVRAQLSLDGTGQTVAVLDTGIDTNAVGLAGKVVRRLDFTADTPADTCTDNGYLDPYGHGTHVSSIIGGAFDGENAASEGMAPGVKFVDLRVLNCAGQGNMSSVDSAISWLISNHETYGVTVANLSLGTTSGPQNGFDSTSILINRLVAEGVVVVVAAGNSGDGASTIFSPASARHAITVGAMSTSSTIGPSLAPFSSQGPTSDGRDGVDVIAPGVGIEAAASTSRGGGTVVYSGTSMASPYLAGLVALMRQQHPEYIVTGQSCLITMECLGGVDDSTMRNDFASNLKASDWFSAGSDPISGIGAISARATLLGTDLAPNSRAKIGFIAGKENLMTVPAHSSNATITIMLDSPWRTDIWANQYFQVSMVHSDGRSEAVDNSCYNLSSNSCLIYASSFTPRMINIALAATDEVITIRVRTTATREASVSAIGIEGQLAVDEQESNASVLDTDSDLISEAGTLPSSQSPVQDILFVSTNGDVYTMSKAAVSIRAGAYAGIAKVASGSKIVSAVSGLNQTAQSQLDLVGMASDGNRMLLGEFPAGAGLVTADPASDYPQGDNDVVYQLVVHNNLTGTNTLVGPRRIDTNSHPLANRVMFPNFDVGNNAFNSNFLSSSGNSVGYGYMHSTGGNDETQIIGWQGGTNYSTRQEWSFASTDNVHINAVTDSGLLIQTYNNVSGVTLYLLNASDRSMTLIASNAGWGAKFSPDETAYAFYVGGQEVRCVDGGVTKTFTPPAGTSIFQLNGWRQTSWTVANDCSSMIAPIYVPYTMIYGMARLWPNGTSTILAEAEAQATAWRLDASGSHFVTTSIGAFETADTNGIEDTYLGLKTCSFMDGSVDTSGIPNVGNLLSATWTRSTAGFTVSYEWLRNGISISGATGSTYRLTSGDAGTLISIRATLRKPGECPGTLTSPSQTWVPPLSFSNAPPPTISGTLASGNVLTAAVPEWTPSSRLLHYQWLQNHVAIKGATLSTLRLTPALAAGDISVQVTNRLPNYEQITRESLVFGPTIGILSSTPTPTISGSFKVGQTLTANSASWDAGVTLTYQWFSDSSPILGGTSRTLRLTNAHAGTLVTVAITGTKANYESATRTSAVTSLVTGGTFNTAATPAISGIPAVGSILTVNLGDWGATGISFSYQWMRAKRAITGATASTYQPTTADLGQSLSVAVTASKPGFTALKKTTAASDKVGYLFTLTPAPVISGSALVGRTLTAIPGTWDSGAKLTYQWFRNGSAISRATAVSYKLTTGDRGKFISVLVVATKTNYTTVGMMSAAVGPIG